MSAKPAPASVTYLPFRPPEPAVGAPRMPHSLSRTLRRAVQHEGGLLFRRWALGRAHDGVEPALQAASRTIRRKRYCVVVTEGEHGPSARAVQPFPPRRDGTITFGTDPASHKIADIRRTGTCLLVYQDDRHLSCVTLRCEARVVDDPDRVARLFMPSWSAFWPKGPHQDFVAVQCQPIAMSIWDGLSGITPPPFGRASRHLVRVDGKWKDGA